MRPTETRYIRRTLPNAEPNLKAVKANFARVNNVRLQTVRQVGVRV